MGGKENAAIRLAMYAYHFLLVFCSNNVATLHRFGDITTFAVHTWLPVPVTLKSHSFSIRQLKLQAMCAFRFMC